MLQLVAYGHDSRRIEPARFAMLIAAGLALAVATAAVPTLLGHAFFTHTFGFVHIPMVGEVEFASASLFDLGVFLVVVGNVITVIAALSRSR